MHVFHVSIPSIRRLSASVCLAICLCAAGVSVAVYAAPATPHANATTAHPAKPINVNTVDADTLAAVKGIGPTRAKAIIAYRKQHGSFKSLQDLLNVHGIGPGILKRIEPNLTVGS